MVEHIRAARSPAWACCVCACLAYQMNAGDDVENQNVTSNDPPQSSNSTTDDPIARAESWEYVLIPGHGLVQMQELLDEQSEAYVAWEAVGEPIESYEPIAVHAMNPNENNGAVQIRMLPQRCYGDFNQDGRVDMFDLQLFLDAYYANDDSADLNRDGRIDTWDQMTFVLLTTLPCVDAWAA